MHDFSRMNVEDIFSMFGFEDLFGDFFGRRGRRSARQAGPSRGYDLETAVALTIQEVASGTEKTIEFTRQDNCNQCYGSGSAQGSSPSKCPTCGGDGQVARGGGFFQMVSTCPQCRGTGQVITNPCRQCKGTGRVPKKRVVTIKIPRGVHEGQGIRVANEGEPGRNSGPRGDLYCYIRIKPHDFLQRDGNDLIVVVPISFTQASLGATIEVPSLNGTKQLKIPAGTQYGSIFRIKGQGLPDIRSGRSGDELIQVTIETPVKMNSKQRELLEEFQKNESNGVFPTAKGFLDKLKKYFSSKN